jgi:hypothetical protein
MSMNHSVQQGEGLNSIAHKYGLLPDSIWLHPQNKTLRDLRKDGDILLPGDTLYIPDRELKSIAVATSQRHRMRRKGVPAKFRLQLFHNQICRANQRWTLDVDGKQYQGVTDSSGVLKIFIDPEARRGILIIGPDQSRLELQFGELDPITEESGYVKRLRNLGLLTDDYRLDISHKTDDALRAFQWIMDLPLTGEADEATLAALEKIHDRSQLFPRNFEEAISAGTGDY